jgi:osmoprotectant transport system ATP-binding protein
MALIEIDNVTRTFPNTPRPAVDGVSLSVAAGAFVTLLGPSGCGKTTLLKMVNRLYEPSSGRICVDGQDTATVSPTELRRHIGYVIQQTGLFPHLRIEDNIAAVPRLLHWDKARTDARVDEMLALVNLPTTYRKRYPRQLSGGEQQRVGVARALAADPPIILMDEPFGAIDAINRTRLQDELLQIQTRLHKTILFVTHDVEEAFKLGDRIVVMREGQIAQEGGPLELVTRPADAFVGSLIGANDMLRRLSLLPVSAAIGAQADHKWSASSSAGGMQTRTSALQGLPTIAPNVDLRTALGLLLETGAPALLVQDGADAPLGRLDFAAIRHALLL